MVLAQEEARRLKHDYIGSEHILLGLIREEEGLAARVLENFEVTEERTRAQVVRIVGAAKTATEGQIPFTPRGKKILELALREALSLGHNYVGTEHILLGLLREGEGVATRILHDFLGEEPSSPEERVRNEVIRMLSGPRPKSEQQRVDITPQASQAPELDGAALRNALNKAAMVQHRHAPVIRGPLVGYDWVDDVCTVRLTLPDSEPVDVRVKRSKLSLRSVLERPTGG